MTRENPRIVYNTRKLSQALLVVGAIVALASVPVTIAEVHVANNSDEISLNVGTDVSYNVSYLYTQFNKTMTSESSIANIYLCFQNLFRMCS